MGVRAVIVVADDVGQERRFWAPWASKQLRLIPHLARFIHAADRDGIPLNVGGYLTYVATRPGTLPAQDLTGEGWFSDPGQVGDLERRYELLLRQSERTFRYRVYDQERCLQPRGWRCREDLGTRAQLYEAASRTCQELAGNTQRYLDRNNGVTPPHWPSPQDWREQEHQFTQWRRHTDPQLLHRSGPTTPPVPQWYAVRAARTQAKQINTRLREAYPGTHMRTRVEVDGTVNVTVPVALATDTETARIAQTLSTLLGQTFTVSVRPHRPSRHTIHSGGCGPRASANATLTLRPQDHVVTSGSAQPGADGDHAGA